MPGSVFGMAAALAGADGGDAGGDAPVEDPDAVAAGFVPGATAVVSPEGRFIIVHSPATMAINAMPATMAIAADCDFFGAGSGIALPDRPEGLATGDALRWEALATGALMTVGIAGMLGDLAESLLKRDCQSKDASAAVPGFGGVLDVVDAIIYSAPVSYAWLYLLKL